MPKRVSAVFVLVTMAQAATVVWAAQEPPVSQPAALTSPSAHGGLTRDPMERLLPKAAPVVRGAAASHQTAANKTATRVPKPPAGKLEGLFWGGTVPQAIINGNVYRVGERMGEGKIASIDRDGVTLDTPQGTYLFSSAGGAPTLIRQNPPPEDPASAASDAGTADDTAPVSAKRAAGRAAIERSSE